MATAFGVSEGVLLHYCVQKKQSITGNYYATLIHRLREAIKAKRCGMLREGVLLHQNNALPHRAVVVMAAIHSCGYSVVNHPPYLTDLAASNFHLYPQPNKKIFWCSLLW